MQISLRISRSLVQTHITEKQCNKSHLWHSQTNKQKTVHGNNGLY